MLLLLPHVDHRSLNDSEKLILHLLHLNLYEIICISYEDLDLMPFQLLQLKIVLYSDKYRLYN